MSPLVLRIGPMTFVITAPPEYRSLIRIRYRQFLLSKKISSVDYSVTLEPLIPGSRARSLAVKSGHDHRIVRHDFQSYSDEKFNHTHLRCALNEYAFDSWLRIFITLAGSTRGLILVHGAGTRIGNAAFVFAGVSGRGKSTITRLLGVRHALSDELTLLSVQKKGVYAHSTPFWGELARPAAPPQPPRPLKRLYFLQHGPTLAVVALDRGTVLSQLMATILFFSREPSRARAMMATAAEIISRIPAAALQFSLHTSRADLCRRLKGS